MADVEKISSSFLPQEYPHWRDEIISLIERSKLQAVLNVNKEMLALYWKIGCDILHKQKELGWGTQVIKQLSQDLRHRFPEDDGYSERNLGYMKQFAAEYPDFPFLQVPLAKLQEDEILQVALAENTQTPILQVPLAPTIGLLLCPTKSNEKVRFSLRGFSQPMGVAEYEIKQLIEEVQSALPSIEEKA